MIASGMSLPYTGALAAALLDGSGDNGENEKNGKTARKSIKNFNE